MRSASLWILILLGGSGLAMAEASSVAEIPVPLISVIPLLAKSSCGSALVASQAHLPGILNIGVLVRMTKAGRLKLVRGFYLTGAHQILLMAAFAPEIEKVLWMGEMRFDVVDDHRPLIYAANETSKHYYENLMDQPWIENGRIIPVENNVDNIPAELRAPGFDGRHFGDGPIHLAPEFKGKDDSVRHLVGNAFHKFEGHVRKIRRAVRAGQPPDDWAAIADEIAIEREIVRETLLYSLNKNLVSDAEVINFRRMVEALDARPVLGHVVDGLSDLRLSPESRALLRDRITVYNMDPTPPN